MTEPVTDNKTMIVPNTGDLTGAWGTAALNPNFQLIDSMLGGTTTISLSGATTITLSVPATTGVWGGSVPQSSNAMIKFTGAQSGNAIIQFTLPGFYIIDNRCTGTAYVQLKPAVGTGNAIGAPPGKKSQVFFDGVDMDYVNMPEPGTAYDLHNATTYPPWMTACTVLPYLIKDGSTYTSANYTALAAVLGSTFGGNGITTFGVPDERSRMRIGLDVTVNTAASSRVTFAVSGVTGTLMGASGGSQALQSHAHTGSIPDHNHSVFWFASNINFGGSIPATQSVGPDSANREATVQTTSLTPTINATGSGNSQNMPPVIVSFLPLIKT